MALTKIDDRGLKTPIDLQDNEKIRLGTGNDLEIYHDGSNSYLTNDTGILNIQGGGANIQLQAVDGESGLIVKADDAVELYYNGSKKLETTNTGINVIGSDGVTITGLQDGTADLFFHADGGDDNADKWYAGAYADGTFHILNYASGSWEETIKAAGNGAVELYHDNSKKLWTTSNGAEFDGYLTGNDNDTIQLGNAGDLQIYHNGSTSIIDSTTSNLDIQSNNTINIKAADESSIIAHANGGVELYYDNSKKFHTYSEGCSIFGNLNLNDSTSASVGRLRLGDSSDLKIYHDGSHSYIDNEVGSFYIRDTSGAERVRINGYGTAITGGLLFGTDTAAANALDDYEEGTFTPLMGGSNYGSYNITGTGKYTKVGRIVHFQLQFANGDLNNSASGDMRIRGWPFAWSTTSARPVIPVVMCHNVILPDKGNTDPSVYAIYGDSNGIEMYGLTSHDGTDWDGWSITSWESSGLYLDINGSYMT